jgi:hypothetical protein
MNSGVPSGIRFTAPWGGLLRGISVGCTGLVVVVVAVSLWMVPPKVQPVTLLPVIGIAVAALFSIQGYEVRSGELIIRRLGWSTRISLRDLESVSVVPDAMSGSLRVFGNGGLYSFSGWFWSRSLGQYRVWVTDLSSTVVIRAGGHTCVVSPDRPAEFVEAVQRLASAETTPRL